MVLRVLRIGFGLLTLVALAINLDNGISEAPGFRAANFFSSFTVQSNVLAAIALIGTAMAGPRSARWDGFRGLATFAMVVTGLVYNVLLADIAVGVTDPWINDVIHRIMPVVMVVDWVLDPPRGGIDRPTALWWLAYPLAYAAYTLIRGPLAGDFYPYPFIDPDKEGYGQVAINCLGLAVALAVIALAVAWMGNVRRR
jgi:hypothetical protein